MNFKDKVLKYGWMAAAIFAFALLGVQTWRLHGAQLAEATAVTALASAQAAAAQATVKKQEEVRTTEQTLNTSASETRKSTNAKVRTASVTADSLLHRLRVGQSQANSTDLPSTSPVAQDRPAATGDAQPELPNRLGEEDVLEAKRADTVRLHLEACYADYERAEEALRLLGERQEAR